MDIVKIDTVLQETTVVGTAGVTVNTVEGTATGTRVGIGNEVVVVVADVVAAEMAIGMAAAEADTTTSMAADPQGTTMSVDETTAVVTTILERLAGVTETMDLHMANVAAGEERAEMEWGRLNEGRRHLKARHHCPRENARPLGGMFMLRDTNNTVQCRPSRLVCAGHIHYYFLGCERFYLQVSLTSLEPTVLKFRPSLELRVFPLRCLCKRSAWVLAVTRICLDNRAVCT